MVREYDPPPRTRPTGRWRSDFDALGQRPPESDPPVVDGVESIQRELDAHPTWRKGSA